MASYYLRNSSVWLHFLGSSCVAMLSELDELLNRLNQGPPEPRFPFVEATATRWEDTETSQHRRRLHSKSIFKMKKCYATYDIAWIFVSGPTDASKKLTTFYCRICHKDISFLTYGISEILWNLQGIRLQWEASNWGWVRSTKGENSCPLTCLGPWVPVPRRFGSGCDRKRWPSTPSDGVPRWCVPTAWKLRTGRTSLGAVCFDGQPSKSRRWLVTKWVFG